jgi:hypothetical protein
VAVWWHFISDPAMADPFALAGSVDPPAAVPILRQCWHAPTMRLLSTEQLSGLPWMSVCSDGAGHFYSLVRRGGATGPAQETYVVSQIDAATGRTVWSEEVRGCPEYLVSIDCRGERLYLSAAPAGELAQWRFYEFDRKPAGGCELREVDEVPPAGEGDLVGGHVLQTPVDPYALRSVGTITRRGAPRRTPTRIQKTVDKSPLPRFD